jgi:hypothetical protein
MEKKKNKINAKNNMKKVMIYSAIAILVFAVLGVIALKLNSNESGDNLTEKGLSMDDFYSDDNCRCLEKNRYACYLDGFEYNATVKLCMNYAEKKVTSVLMKCSKYECKGIIYEFNADKNYWEAK